MNGTHRILTAALLAALGSLLNPGARADSSDTKRPVSLLLHVDDSATDRPLQLRGADARLQVLVSAIHADGTTEDVTRKVRYEIAPEGLARISKSGSVMPLADGEGTLTARLHETQAVSRPLQVTGFNESPTVNFPNRIVPIFTKAGCNGGGCHGKSGGQNGFRLSLLGFEPAEDYEYLVKEARARRLFPAAPDRSLLLLKGTATLPHGGGKRLEPGSDDYRLLVRWISQGMPYGSTNDPAVARIEVYPRQRRMALGGEQQLVVTAHYTDGSSEDVTRSALYEANDKDMAQTTETGLVQLFRQPGDVAVMVRYQGKVATFRATIPLGATIASLPPPKNFIDEQVFAKLRAVGMPPSDPCDDLTFLRRVTLDVAGRLPTPDEIRRFQADPDPARRDRWVDRLLDSPEYADYFANKWSALLRNKRTDGKHTRGTFAFHGWIRDSLAENKPFDQFVREVLAASGDIALQPSVAWYRQVREMNHQLEDTAQLFLGQRMQCAQCHHHPYEKWSQQDYYSFGAFFSRVGRKAGSQPGEEMIFHRRGPARATHKKTKQPVPPAGLGAPPVSLAPEDDPRQALVDWMTAPDNPYFARSLANRYWKHFFGRGLVEPEDDMRETNPPTNPELLDALARHFVQSGFDLKALVRAICTSRTYQFSALPNEHNKVDKQNFSRFYPRRLTAEVLLDAINQVTDVPSKFDGLPEGTHAVCLPDNSYNQSSYFLQVFGRPEASSSCECERSQDASLAQSLHLLNSKDVQAKLTSDRGRAARLAADTTRADEANVRELYLWAFAREPRPEEIETARQHIAKASSKSSDDKGNPVNGRRQAYEDLLWALINTKEFLFNH
ncbi:MAG TPA: DUF1549 and DUF1553 domain-containing protein [Methylomirabilota bacterium]|nr:DUF1549 and DUF1553 domain-containing protein [Methylomirabilota bacterium]